MRIAEDSEEFIRTIQDSLNKGSYYDILCLHNQKVYHNTLL